jgi:hypothetical protein
VDISFKDDVTVSFMASTDLGVVPTAATTVLTLLQGFLQKYSANLKPVYATFGETVPLSDTSESYMLFNKYNVIT